MNDKPIGLILSKRTESLRLYLLIVSFIDILVINVGLFPKEINTFSIKIDHIDYSSFLILILLLTSFFTITFGFFASVDWMNYKLLLSADDTINDWEKRKIDLSKDKYEQAINEFRVSLKQGIGRIQEQIRKMDFIFHLPPDHSFYSMKKKVRT